MSLPRPFSLRLLSLPTMIRIAAALALLLLTLPATAQGASAPSGVEVSNVDPAIVGDWTLMKVVEIGEIGRYGAVVRAMECAFDAGGAAEVRLSIEQDRDVTERTRAFRFTTDQGRIKSKGRPGLTYQVLGGDLLELRSKEGLVVHLRRADEGG